MRKMNTGYSGVGRAAISWPCGLCRAATMYRSPVPPRTSRLRTTSRPLWSQRGARQRERTSSWDGCMWRFIWPEKYRLRIYLPLCIALYLLNMLGVGLIDGNTKHTFRCGSWPFGCLPAVAALGNGRPVCVRWSVLQRGARLVGGAGLLLHRADLPLHGRLRRRQRAPAPHTAGLMGRVPEGPPWGPPTARPAHTWPLRCGTTY